MTLDRHGRHVERGSVHALPVAIDWREPQHVVRVCNRRRIAIDRRLTHVVDHANASQGASDRSAEVKYVVVVTSASRISDSSTSANAAASTVAGSAVRTRAA